jgi:hypothetical protein
MGVASVRLEIPVGVSVYPRETLRPSRRWVDRWMPNLIHYNILERGHFAAWEPPGCTPRISATASPGCAERGRVRRGSEGLSQSNEKRKAMIDHIYLSVSETVERILQEDA